VDPGHWAPAASPHCVCADPGGGCGDTRAWKGMGGALAIFHSFGVLAMFFFGTSWGSFTKNSLF